MSNKAYLLGKVAFVSTYAIILSISTNIFMPVNAVASAVDNTNSITLQNSATVPTVKASDYAAAQAAKEKSEASVKTDYEAQKAEFAKANKITVALLNDELSGKVKNPKYLDAFSTFITTRKLKVAKDRMNALSAKSAKTLTKAESTELKELQYGFRNTLTQTTNSSISSSSINSFGPSQVQTPNYWYPDIKVNTLGTIQVSAIKCVKNGYQIPAPYDAGDILFTRVGQNFYNIPITGHSGIIINYSQTVEAPGPHQNSQIKALSDWCHKTDLTSVGYVKGANKARAVSVATSWMLNRPYPEMADMGLVFAFDLWGRNLWDISTVYCSKLVWRIYADQGKYLDSTRGGGLVTPVDLLYDNDTLFNYSWATLF